MDLEKASTVSELDDLWRIKRIDRAGICGVQERFPEDCEDAVERGKTLKIPRKLRIGEKLEIHYGKPDNVIVVGMGGSAIGGIVLKDWLRDVAPIPIEVWGEYELPAYANEKTLVFVLSYSGNTEEAISGFVDAVERECMVVAVSSDGVLLEFSERLKIPFVKLPEKIQPRCAFPYLFFPLLMALKKLGIIEPEREEVEEAIEVLREVRSEVKPESPTSRNLAKRLALDVKDSVPIIYGFGIYRGVAQRIKTQFNENSKIPSKCEVFPELNHNEVVGWTGPDRLTRNFTVILIRDKNEPSEIKARIDVTKKLVLEKKAGKVTEVYARGRSKLARMFSVIYTGDFASVYLAILYGVDPTPIDVITRMKMELEKRTDVIEKLRNRLNLYLTKNFLDRSD